MGKEAGSSNEIRIDDLKKELESNTTGIVDKKTSPLLYKIIDEQAKRLGIDIEKEGIKIRLAYGFDDNEGTAPHGATIEVSGKNKEYKKLTIGYSYVAGGLIGDGIKGDQTINPENLNLGLLKSVLSHEFQHYKDAMNDKNHGNPPSRWSLLKNALLKGDPYSEFKEKECRADFAADSKDINGRIEKYSADAFMNNAPDLFHPSPTDRVKLGIIKSYIGEKTGIELNSDDVSFQNGHCEFKITNKAKLAAITPEVFKEAVEYAERDNKQLKDKIAESERREAQDYIKRMGGSEGVKKFEKEMEELNKKLHKNGVSLNSTPDHNAYLSSAAPLKPKQHQESGRVAYS